MSYNTEEFPHYVRTAGKITIVTALAGLLVFMVAFMFDIGKQEISKVSAQTATTTLTVLNTPPSFIVETYEVVESSTSSPTNSGDIIQWSALGSDSNGAPYFLLVCSTNAVPTANAAANAGSLGTAPPDCGAGAIQWGVSTGTVSNTLATVSTTTSEAVGSSFGELNNWYSWVCDDDPVNPRCNSTPSQGLYATSSAPFNMNRRPVFTDFANNGPVDPGAVLTFFSTSSDPDTVGGADDIYLVVCGTNTDYNANTNTCDSNFIASTTISVLSDASATYTLASIVRDNTYGGYGYVVDQHGHEAATNPLNADFVVNNVAPVVLGGDITIYGENGPGTDLTVSVPAGETPSSTLEFTIRDANSCENASGGAEIQLNSFLIGVYRGTTTDAVTCDGTGTNYDPNNCYDSGVPTSVWNLQCNATTTCGGPTQDNIDFKCTFPLWFVADPTDAGATNIPLAFANDDWFAAVAGIDDDNATGTMATTSNPVDLISFSSIDIKANEIAYGGIEPGNNSGTLSATSTLLNVGNTGLDQEAQGESMCGTYTVSTECPVSATSTIPESEQEFSSTTLAYGSPLALTLSSTTPHEVELDVNKTTSTTTPNEGTTYWGIAVPGSITLAGSYQGLNTFTAVTAEAVDW